MRFPPGESIRSEACPSHVSAGSLIGLLSGRWAPVAGRTRNAGPSGRASKLMRVSRRAVALALVLAAAAADAAGAHGIAFYALVGAVPASAAAGLAALGRTIDRADDEIVLLQALLWGLLLVLLVLGCASRSHSLDVAGVPAFARSTLAA